jgi:hypothetical protein
MQKKNLQKLICYPKIKNKYLLTTELSSILSRRDKDLVVIPGILTSMLDGQVLETDTGAHGHRDYQKITISSESYFVQTIFTCNTCIELAN